MLYHTLLRTRDSVIHQLSAYITRVVPSCWLLRRITPSFACNFMNHHVYEVVTLHVCLATMSLRSGNLELPVFLVGDYSGLLDIVILQCIFLSNLVTWEARRRNAPTLLVGLSTGEYHTSDNHHNITPVGCPRQVVVWCWQIQNSSKYSTSTTGAELKCPR